MGQVSGHTFQSCIRRYQGSFRIYYYLPGNGMDEVEHLVIANDNFEGDPEKRKGNMAAFKLMGQVGDVKGEETKDMGE